MTNKVNTKRGEVALTLGDETYKLVPSYENIAYIEETTGTPIIELVNKIQSRKLKVIELIEVLDCVAEPELDAEVLKNHLEANGVIDLIIAVGEFLVMALTGGRNQETRGKSKISEKMAQKKKPKKPQKKKPKAA